MAFNAKAAGAIGGILLAAGAAAPIVMKWEGWETRAYPDVVDVWTACMGTTRGIKKGDVFTDQQCETKAVVELAEYAAAISPCLPKQLPVETRAAFISAAYNIGPPAFCKSSMSRRALAGDLPGACDALLMWNKAGGRVVKGLDNRRRDERALCLKGLQ
jgi:lysozyme